MNDRLIDSRPRDEIVRLAEEAYCSEDIEIDSDTAISRGSDGTWVQAWVFVPGPDA